MKHKLLFLLLLFAAAPAFPQSERPKELVQKAIALMDEGNYDASIATLEEALVLDPKNPNIEYELALAYYLKEDYSKALDATKKLIKTKKAFDQVYQLRGNSYDMMGNRDKALKTYEAGLKKFPSSGPLYLEKGIVLLKEEQNEQALATFEAGIAAAPLHPSNYYWAAKLFLGSEEEVWGMLYGELFRVLEPNSERSTEISKLLYDTYKSEIKYTSDTSMSVSFSKNNIIGFSKKGSSLNLPFGTVAYETTLAMSAAGTRQIDLASLNKIRTSFVQNFYKNEINTRFDNPLFQWQQTLLNEQQLEAYNYWLLQAGNPEQYNSWLEQNQAQLDAFVAWFNENGQPISKDSYVHRSKLDNISLTAGE
ncbi:tetratricopeptide repeat protein [Pontibacter mangrovi]|nr:tetratricopeptide repeat protein [Pontibacter mangrovi]